MLGFVAAPLSAQNTLTVADGTATNDYVPFYGYYLDADQHCQVIYPDSMLTDMQGSAITQMEFYLNSNPSFTSTITFRMGISPDATFASATFDNTTTLTEVYVGSINIENNVMTVELDEPYTYNGGNLLLDFTNTNGNYIDGVSFYGITSIGASVGVYTSWGSATLRDFIPKTTFSYGVPPACSKPTNVIVLNTTTTEATISWIGDESTSSYNIQYMLSSETDWENALTATAYDTSVMLTNLQPSSAYKVRVQAVCSDNTETNWSSVCTFQTGCDAITITNENPWSEDFEGYQGYEQQPLMCWDIPMSTSSYNAPFVYCGWSASCHSGANSVEMKGLSGQTMMLVLPEFNNTPSDLRLSFWATSTNPAYGILEIGVLGDMYDLTTFEILDTCGMPGARGADYTFNNGNLMGPFDFNSITATTGRIALRFTSTFGSYDWNALSWNLDDFTVSLIPACAEPTGLANVNVTATSADITWNAADGSSYDLIYWADGGSDTTIVYGASLTDNVYTLTDLNPSSSYTWYVRTDCGDGTYALSFAQLSFSTPGLPVELPYERTFEEGDDNPVTEFTFQGTGNNQWVIGTATFMPDADDPTAEGHSLYISDDNGVTNNYNTSNTSYAYAILNVSFDESLEYHLAFDYKTMGEGSSYTIYDYLSVYLMDAGVEVPTNANPSGTALLSQQYNVGDWTHADYLLENVAGTSKKIVFFWTNDYTAGTNPPAAIDNISIQGFSCAQPSNLTATNITASSATLNWQENGTATSWNVYYRPVGGSEWLVETATDESLEITGLGNNTKYEFYVTSDCSGEESSPSATAEFRTLCGNDGISVLPFTEDFEGDPVDGYVVCWTRSTNDSTGQHNVYQNVGEVWAWGSKALDFGYTPGCYTQATLPMFDSSIPLNTLKVEFDARRGSADGAFLLGAITDPYDDDTFEVIDTIFTTCTGSYYSCGWEHVTIYCNNYTGSGQYLAFRADNCGNSARLIDNLVIDYLPACLPISNLYVSDLTMEGATISWSGDADSYNVYVGGNIYSTTDTFIVINDLASSSSYTVAVRAICASDSSELSNTISFNTSCGAITVTADTPWFEDFEGYSGGGEQPFVCWDAPVSDVTYHGPFVYCGYGQSCHSGVNSAEFKGANNMLVLPIFSNDIHELRLSFWATATNTSVGTVEVGVITNAADPTTFELLGDAGAPGPRGSASAGNGNYMGPFDFNGVQATSGRIALRYTSNSASQSWNLDDFTVELVPDCPSPVKTSVTATNVDGHNATISWTDNDPTHTAWIVYYKASSESDWSFESAAATTLNLTGLDPETTYDVYVVTDCGTTVDNLDATMTIHFTTLVACPAPQNITAAPTTDGAVVTWFGTADSYTVVCGDFTATVTETTATITGLNPATTYTVSITADCGTEGTSSAGTVTFMTACDVISVFPYNEGFESGALGCWSQETIAGNNPWTVYNYGGNNGSNCVSINYTDNTSSRLISPIFDLTNLTNPMISFYYQTEDYYGSLDTLAVFYRTSVTDEWVRITGYDQVAEYYVKDSLVLPNPSASYQIAFVGYANDGYGIYLDDIQIYDASGSGPVLTDPTVATTAASAIGQTTATLNATITNPDNVSVSAKGFEWKATMGGTYTQIAGTGTGNSFTANLTGLTANTGYTYKAFITFNGTTVYGSEMTFTTLPDDTPVPCDAPTGLTASNITKESFEVSWNTNANVSSWNVRYRVAGGQWTTATVNTNQYAVSGLTAETNYEVQVQADCGDNNLSDWSETLNVTTLVDGINSYLLNSIALYPNPAKDVVNVQSSKFNVQSVEVIDVYGKVINTVDVVDNPTCINVSGLANGIYFVRVTTEEGVVTKNFINR